MRKKKGGGENAVIEHSFLESAAAMCNFLLLTLPTGEEIEALVDRLDLPKIYIDRFRCEFIALLSTALSASKTPKNVSNKTSAATVVGKILKPMEQSLPEILTRRLRAAISLAILESFTFAMDLHFKAKELREFERRISELGRHPNLSPRETRGRKKGVTTTEVVQALKQLGDSAPEAEQQEVARKIRKSTRALQNWQREKGFENWKTARRACLDKIPGATNNEAKK